MYACRIAQSRLNVLAMRGNNLNRAGDDISYCKTMAGVERVEKVFLVLFQARRKSVQILKKVERVLYCPGLVVREWKTF